MHGLISGTSILFHRSMCQFLCQYAAVFVNIAVKYNLELGMVIPLGILSMILGLFLVHLYVSMCILRLGFISLFL